MTSYHLSVGGGTLISRGGSPSTVRPRHDTIGSLGARRKLHESARRLARRTNRSSIWISVRDAARELHDPSRAVLWWTEPPETTIRRL